MVVTLRNSFRLTLSKDEKITHTKTFLEPLCSVNVAEGGIFVVQTKGWNIPFELPGAPFEVIL